MIQRIQSIFLALVAVCMIMVVALPIWDKTDTQNMQNMHLNAFSLTYTQGNKIVEANSATAIYIAILAIVVFAISVFSIFSFKNRILQMKLGMANSMTMLVLMVVNVLTIYKAEKIFNETQKGDFSFGFWAIVAGILFNIAANFFIRKDQKLVESSNRMR